MENEYFEQRESAASDNVAAPKASAIVLMYHRVAEEICDPWGLCVVPERFEQHLQIIREFAHVIPLRRLANDLQNVAESGHVIITFDDGYADNFHEARPLLERYDFPATFFLVSGHLGQRTEFWWDELDRLLLQPGVLPQRLELEIGGVTLNADLTGATVYTAAQWHANRNWRAWDNPPTARHSLYYTLWKQMRPMRNSDQKRILEMIRGWAGVGETGRGSRLTLTHGELSSLRNHGLIEVGCHTRTHPQLSSLPVSNQLDEVRGCKEDLEEMLGTPMETFAYPYGGKDDFTADSAALARDIGLSAACSTISGAVRHDSDPFQLPRIPVENWDGDEFARRLTQWLAEG